MTRTINSRNIMRGRKIKHHQPTIGSQMRETYDALRRGETIFTYSNSRDPRYGRPNHCVAAAIQRLTDFYGMVIRRLPDGGHVLDGEWCGPYYMTIDQILAETMANEMAA